MKVPPLPLPPVNSFGHKENNMEKRSWSIDAGKERQIGGGMRSV